MTDPYHAQLWVVGDVSDYSSWLKTDAAGLLRKAPAEGKSGLIYHKTNCCS
jgi:hypothetical protein